MPKEQIKKTVNFIFELGQLKREPRRGFFLAGVRQPDSIAEHSLRAAQIGYILAEMENERAGGEIASSEKVAAMLMIHDTAEARIGDQHKVGARYADMKEAEKNAFKEQISGIGRRVEVKWKLYMAEYGKRKSKEGIIAQDADWLEVAFQAKEYLDLGYASAEEWVSSVEAAVETESAKEILRVMKETRFTDWWNGLKKMTYEKLGK